MTLQAIIKVQDDTAKLWGVTPVDIDKAFMKKVAMYKDLYKGLKIENAVDLQKGFDGKSLVFSFYDGRKVKLFEFETNKEA